MGEAAAGGGAERPLDTGDCDTSENGCGVGVSEELIDADGCESGRDAVDAEEGCGDADNGGDADEFW